MAALGGWAPRGQRLTAKVPHGRWKTMTFLAALRCDRIEEPWFVEGSIDGDSFRVYVEKVLLTTLRHNRHEAPTSPSRSSPAIEPD